VVRWLKLPIFTPPGHDPGLIMLQVDSLAHDDFLHAIDRGTMPFLRRLLKDERYQLRHFFSGVPSSTPSVQGELFYGVRQAVPAFEYLDGCGKVFALHTPRVAEEIERRLAAEAKGLLTGGSSYGNIFSGGALESHFCLGTLDSQSYWKTFMPYAWFIVLIFNPVTLIHAASSFIFDLGTALVEFLRGLRGWRGLKDELKSIPVRIFVTIFLREFITLGCRMDVSRSMPVICANFFGYDEIAHRYGKNSFFARSALRRIDSSIRKIFKTANCSISRDYDVWIYSDHGQEATDPYYMLHKTTLKEKAAEVLGRVLPPLSEEKLTITAQGPLGFIYTGRDLSDEEKRKSARALVAEAGVPLVLSVLGGRCAAWTEEGELDLIRDAAKLFGPDHFYVSEVAEGLEQICRRLDTGDFVISGWRPKGKPVSFPVEWASHGGPGRHETDGFVLLPFNTPIDLIKKGKFLRPSDLRCGAIHFMEGEKRKELLRKFMARGPGQPLRIMSYNVHSCIGIDRRLSPERIARVIARHAPDVVALQELDRGRLRSRGDDQAHEIAALLGMTYHFFPVMRIEEEEYGDAILSRHPMRLIREGALACHTHIPDLEPRGALWVEIDFFGRKVQLVNTHFSLLGSERMLETKDLLGKDWMGSKECVEPLILCGDLNMLPRAKANQLFRERFRDVLGSTEGGKGNTYPSFRPIARLDYIYVSKDIEIAYVDVPRMSLERVASDHFPVVADLHLPPR